MHSRCASRRIASGAVGFSRQMATPRSSVSGTQYLRHAASSFLTVFGLSPSAWSAERQPSSCSCTRAVSAGRSCSGNWGKCSPGSSDGATVGVRPYAKGRGEGRGAGRGTTASGRASAGCRGMGAGRKRSRATARRGAEAGGAGDGSGRCVSRSTLATTASPPEGPGWGSTSPAR